MRASVQIDAVFVDARNVKHPSLGNVESSEYAAIQQHFRTIQEAAENPTIPRPANCALHGEFALPPASASAPTVGRRFLHVQPDRTGTAEAGEALRHQVELRVKDPGAQLRSAPFHSAATLESLPDATEVLIVVLTPYWYGVETEDGHHGWIHHSQLEPLP